MKKAASNVEEMLVLIRRGADPEKGSDPRGDSPRRPKCRIRLRSNGQSSALPSRSGMIPVLGVRVCSPNLGGYVRLFRSRDVPALTGLTADQLREWTVRRGLVQPDEPAQKRGSEARFSWQTLLVLRLAVVLRTRFHVELQAHRELLASARKLLGGASFPGLWGGTLAIYGMARCELLSARMPPPAADDDAILLRLNRHLEALSQGLGLPEPATQLPLFPAVGLMGTAEGRASERRLADGARR